MSDWNGLADAWLVAAVQVTVLALAAGVLATRRWGGVVPSLSLAAGTALTLLAFCPLPQWWAWRTAHVAQSDPFPIEPEGTGAIDQARDPGAHATEPTSVGVPLWGIVKSLWAAVSQTTNAKDARFREVRHCLALLFLASAGIGVLRLLLGLWAIRCLRRESASIGDEAARVLLGRLAEHMGCPRPVELRESADLDGPATLGWRRPVILLPADWRAWTHAQRQTVLAHELAHVRRRDYLMGCLARLGLALHYYHPLWHWLVGRLCLQQELAADTLAARFAGGRGQYLAALAELALGHARRPIAWPARSFLPRTGTLLRRIHMLRVKEDRHGWMGRAGRAATAALRNGVAVGLSLLRAPGSVVAEETQAGVVAKQAEPLSPVDLCYTLPGAKGALVLRPAAIFSRSGMKPYADMINALLIQQWSQIGPGLGLPNWPELGLRVEEIDAVVAGIFHHRDANAPAGRQNSVLTNVSMLRTVKDVDWKKHLAALDAKFEASRHAGQTYYRARMDAGPFFGRLAYCLPDARTLVIGKEEQIRGLLERAPGVVPDYVWKQGWDEVSRFPFALVFDGRDDWLKDLKDEGDDADARWARLVKRIRRLALGVDAGDQLVIRGVALAENEDSAKITAALGEAILGQVRGELQVKAKDVKGNAVAPLSVSTALAEQCRIERQGSLLRVRSVAKVDLPSLAALVRGIDEQ